MLPGQRGMQSQSIIDRLERNPESGPRYLLVWAANNNVWKTLFAVESTGLILEPNLR